MGEMCEIGMGEGRAGHDLTVGKGNVVVVSNWTGKKGRDDGVGNVIPEFDKKNPGFTGA